MNNTDKQKSDLNPNVYILAAGYRQQSQKPCSLWSFGNGKSILDWQIGVIKSIFPSTHPVIAIGYDYESIIEKFPKQKFEYVLGWQNSSPMHSFLSLLNDKNNTNIVMYGDTVFHSDTFKEFNEQKGDVVIAIDLKWKKRFSDRSRADILLAETLETQNFRDAEYTGLAKFSPEVSKWIIDNKNKYDPHSNFIDLLDDIRKQGFKIFEYDVAGDWAEMNQPSDLARFILGSKAETLSRIKPKLKKSIICDQITAIWENWENNPNDVIKEIQSTFNEQFLIIRSSSKEEDGWDTANAGVFESVLNVDSSDVTALSNAIHKVFSSYDNLSNDTQVLIQPYVKNVEMSGVLFTCDLLTGAPYYILNYDNSTGLTDTITSGQSEKQKTLVLFKNTDHNYSHFDPEINKVISAAKELELLLGHDKLDIEFAIDKHGLCYTFQIRPITVQHNAYQSNAVDISKHLNIAQKQFISLQNKNLNILGDYTFFSRMTDWNPAEIIGTKPNYLATSLYNHLITEDIWAKQRKEFGYRDTASSPLVYNFCAQPYVDCRASINSFIPADLNDDCAARLVNAYLGHLLENQYLHDKLEIDVVFTIWTPTFLDKAKERFKNTHVTQKDINELEQSLKILTANALNRLDKDISSIAELLNRFEFLNNSKTNPVNKAYQLIQDCKKYGTLAFAHAARAGFVSVTILKSLVENGSLTYERMLEFQTSIPTITSELQAELANENISIDQLIRRFGHLRPGTYDVNQQAYWEDPYFYFNRSNVSKPVNKNCEIEFSFTQKEMNSFQEFLDQIPTEISVKQFINYLSKAIQAREMTKFEFTRNISTSIDILIEYGMNELGLSREKVGYLNFDDIRLIHNGQLNEELISKYVDLRIKDFNEKQLAKLPSFISDKDDFLAYHQQISEANYITRSNVIADIVFVGKDKEKNISGKIVAIPNADPGFDWIFSYGIAGLITQYGGANSHMAIRCAELEIPAAIGIGEIEYEGLYDGLVLLDCLKGYIKYV